MPNIEVEKKDRKGMKLIASKISNKMKLNMILVNVILRRSDLTYPRNRLNNIVLVI